MEFDEIIKKKNWEKLINNFLPVRIVDTLFFSKAMLLVGSLLSDSAEETNFSFADRMRDYAINLMIILRAKYPKEWKEDWKNEAFLGIICCINFREEEGFEYLKNAHASQNDSPQSLLIALANSSTYPGLELSKKELHSLVQRALEKGLTYESTSLKASIAETKEEQNTWEQKAHELEKTNTHTPIITPNILKNILPAPYPFQNEN